MANTCLSEEKVFEILGATNLESKETHADDPIVKTRIRVTLDQLRPYDNNPRTTRNPKFDGILASIENAGLEQPPNISRRSMDDPHYMIIDGGNTRLEILNLLYEKYSRLAQQAESDEQRLTLSQKAESFFTIDCIFKPWVSESKALTGHMSENENRGDMLFIEKAIAVQKLKQLYETEDRDKARSEGLSDKPNPLSGRQLAARITAQGWSIDQSHISRYDYTTNTLLKSISNALWAGAGAPLVRNIRRYDVVYTRYWQSTEPGKAEPDRIQSIFLETLRNYDGERVDLQGFLRDLDDQLGKRLDLHTSFVTVEIDALMHGRSAFPGSQEPQRLSHEELVKKYKDTAPPVARKALDTPPAFRPPGFGADTKQNASAKKAKSKSDHGQHNAPVADSEDKNTDEKLLGKVHTLASRYDDIHIIEISKEEHRSGSPILFGVAPIDRTLIPGKDDELGSVWWALTKYSLSFRGDQQNRYSGFTQVIKKMFGQYFERYEGALGTLLLFEEGILRCPPDVRDKLREIQGFCELMIEEIKTDK